MFINIFILFLNETKTLAIRFWDFKFETSLKNYLGSWALCGIDWNCCCHCISVHFSLYPVLLPLLSHSAPQNLSEHRSYISQYILLEKPNSIFRLSSVWTQFYTMLIMVYIYFSTWVESLKYIIYCSSV